MSEENDRHVAAQLAAIQQLLTTSGHDVRRLERRLLGDDDNDEKGGGIVGAHNRRLQRLETWFIRVSTAIVVWTFMTGSGPVSLASVIHLFTPK